MVGVRGKVIHRVRDRVGILVGVNDGGGGVAHERQQVCSACAGGGKYLEGWVEGKGCMERRGLGKVGGGTPVGWGYLKKVGRDQGGGRRKFLEGGLQYMGRGAVKVGVYEGIRGAGVQGEVGFAT